MVLRHDVPSIISGVATPGVNVTVSRLSESVTVPAAAGSGTWRATLSSMPITTTPFTIFIATTDGDTIFVEDVVVGDVIVASGQSNMQLYLSLIAYNEPIIANASMYGPMVRFCLVANLDSYQNVTSPQTNLTMQIPWTRASPSVVPNMSALAYVYATMLSAAHPDIPIGVICTNWPGTAIELWMSPDALEACGEGVSTADQLEHSPDTSPLGEATDASVYSTLWNSMVAPLLSVSVTSFLWYQGESNCGNPVGYSMCFPAMIADWRAKFSASSVNGTDPESPFIFVQLSAWPAGDNGLIATQRYAQMAALALPNTAAVVAADLGDPSGAWHPVHPPWKVEVARRAFLAADNLVYGNASSPKSSPALISATVNLWDASWGAYHYGYGSMSVCGTEFTCAGIQLCFDQPVVVKSSYGTPQFGFSNGFDLFNAAGYVNGTFQPVTLTGLVSIPGCPGGGVQLNTTWTYGVVADSLRYAWHDYPTMLIFSTDFDLPALPFNVSVSIPAAPGWGSRRQRAR